MAGRAALELDTLTIRIPIRLQRRGGRKLIMAPEGAAVPTPKPRRDETLIKGLVRAHRWRRRIESGQVRSITDLAEQEVVTDAYVCRLLPLTCLAPDIVEAILDGRQPKGLRLAEVLGNGPVAWEEQRGSGAFPGAPHSVDPELELIERAAGPCPLRARFWRWTLLEGHPPKSTSGGCLATPRRSVSRRSSRSDLERVAADHLHLTLALEPDRAERTAARPTVDPKPRRGADVNRRLGAE